MPKGQFSRPGANKKKGYMNPDGDRKVREAAASGKAKNYTSAKISDEDFQKEMRMRERGSGTGQNEGYVGNGKIGKDKIDPKNKLNTSKPEKDAKFFKHTEKNY